MKEQIREGQPLSSRNAQPSMKRDRFANNVNENAVERLGKIIAKLGGTESTPKEDKKIAYQAIKHFFFVFRKALTQAFSGNVYVLFDGRVNYEFHMRDFNAISKSFIKILERAGFRVSQFNFDMDGNGESPNYYKNTDDIGFPYFTGTFDTVEEAVKAFSKLYIILSKANDSYDKFNTQDDMEYYAKKGYVAGDTSYPFSIVRDSDGNSMISGKITPDGFIVLDSHSNGETVYTLTWRKASDKILDTLKSFGFHTEGALYDIDPVANSPSDLKKNLKVMIDAINSNSHANNAELDPNNDDGESFCDDLKIEWETPTEHSINDARKKRLTKMKATAANDAANRFKEDSDFEEEDEGAFWGDKRYVSGCCSDCGRTPDDIRVDLLQTFLTEHGYDVETSCELLDRDPCEEICADCWESYKAELDSYLRPSEYDDLGIDTRTGEEWGIDPETGEEWGAAFQESDEGDNKHWRSFKFSPEEIKMIRDRMEVEHEWGPSVYEKEDLDAFKSIMSKCDSCKDGILTLSTFEIKKITDRLEIECHEWGGSFYEEKDLEIMEMILGKFNRAKLTAMTEMVKPATQYKEIHVKGFEDDHGVNPFYFFKDTLKTYPNKKLVFDCLQDYFGEKGFSCDEDKIPSIAFKKKGETWDVIFTAPVFDRDHNFVKMASRTIKDFKEMSAATLYGLMLTTHGGVDREDIDRRFRSENITALRMVPHCQYPGGFGKEDWMKHWDMMIRLDTPSISPYYGWIVKPSTIKNLFDPLGNY